MTRDSAPLSVGVLVSGRGSNLEAILKAVKRGYIPRVRIAVVISNSPGVRALRIAAKYGVETEVVTKHSGEERAGYDSRLLEALKRHGVTPGKGLVLLAGFMRLLSPGFVELYKDRILNVHPSLLPSFPGVDAQKQALEHGVKVSGCTVHLVVPDVDAGPIILQQAVRVRESDTVETLSHRILRQEHRLYPLAVKLFVEGRLGLNGRRVTISA